jgi:hypothetical protein
VRTTSGRGFTPGGTNGGRRGSVASAHARGKRPGRVYKGAGGRLRGRGVNHVADARAAWAARRCDVRRSGGQWRAAVGMPASGI